MNNTEEIRAMILSLAAAEARRCIEVTKSQNLTTAQVETMVDTGESKWGLIVTYRKDTETVHLQGSPIGMTSAEMLLGRIFGGNDEDDHSFSFQVPAQWIPEMEL